MVSACNRTRCGGGFAPNPAMQVRRCGCWEPGILLSATQNLVPGNFRDAKRERSFARSALCVLPGSSMSGRSRLIEEHKALHRLRADGTAAPEYMVASS